MSIELAPAELTQLEACEQAIERAKSAFVDAGTALRKIRDGKLYRATHGTFELYCQDRWGYSRSRAYELIDRADVVAKIETATGTILSAAADISKREVRQIKAASEAIPEIKERVSAGEEPLAAIKAVAAAVRGERQADKPQPAAKPSAHPPTDDDDRADRVEELEAIVEDLTSENAALKAQVAALEPMRLEYERGGFAEVVAGLTEQIRVLKTRVESESREKVKNLRSMEFWREKARERGYSRDAVIDLETGEITNG